MTFGLGDQIFASPATDNPEQPEQDHDNCSDAESDDSSSSEDSLITAMASTRVESSFWAAAPRYPAIYLSTLSECISQPAKEKVPTSVVIEDPVDGKSGKDKDSTWALESYENSVEIDNVFDRFTKRVEFVGEQCLRWVTTMDEICP
jgi:pre-rRNA-processing protein TSR4